MREHIDWPERHELMITENEEHRQGMNEITCLVQFLMCLLAKAFIRTLLQKEPSARADSSQALLHSVSVLLY